MHDDGWEDCKGAIWWVRRWLAVGEKVQLEWLDTITQQHAVVVLAKSFAPELIKGHPHQNESAHLCDYSPTAHLGLVCVRIPQHRDTVGINAVK
jgi:hypothetical protein